MTQTHTYMHIHTNHVHIHICTHTNMRAYRHIHTHALTHTQFGKAVHVLQMSALSEQLSEAEVLAYNRCPLPRRDLHSFCLPALRRRLKNKVGDFVTQIMEFLITSPWLCSVAGDKKEVLIPKEAGGNTDNHLPSLAIPLLHRLWLLSVPQPIHLSLLCIRNYYHQDLSR